MRIKCESCGKRIRDTDDTCPHCGAFVNRRSSSVTVGEPIRYPAKEDTPRTIEELQAWYEARNLPPYDVTRFFIGHNYPDARAFGIYRDGANCVVYKNKADGSRAIRYEGPDEAYAVNELYERLREEILHQKSRGSGVTRSGGSAARSGKRRRAWLPGVIACAVALLITFGVELGLYLEKKVKPCAWEYYSYNGAIYYCDRYYTDTYRWWKYAEEAGDYEDCLLTEEWDRKHPERSFPDGMNNKNSLHEYSAYGLYLRLYPEGDEPEAFDEKYDIYNSHAYIDGGNHYTPFESGYYAVNDQLYYYLDDSYEYDGDYAPGWYVFENDDWVYFADGYFRDTLGDELWYDDDKYCIGESFSDYSSGELEDGLYGNTWIVDDGAFPFEDTKYYDEYSAAERAYENRIREWNERESSDHWSDSDNDYDWDSGDSWDSGSTDWDSDW